MGATTIVSEIESSIDNKFAEASNKLVAKEDLLLLKLELRSELKENKLISSNGNLHSLPQLS